MGRASIGQTPMSPNPPGGNSDDVSMKEKKQIIRFQSHLAPEPTTLHAMQVRRSENDPVSAPPIRSAPRASNSSTFAGDVRSGDQVDASDCGDVFDGRLTANNFAVEDGAARRTSQVQVEEIAPRPDLSHLDPAQLQQTYNKASRAILSCLEAGDELEKLEALRAAAEAEIRRRKAAPA